MSCVDGKVHGLAALRLLTVVAIAVCAAVAGVPQASRAGPGALPALGADLPQTSVSGLSSGAYMAGQFQIAHSKIVTGAGIVAGGPYGCAESAAARLAPFWSIAVGYNLTQAVQGCMANRLKAWGIPDVDGLAKRTAEFAGKALIDSLEHLRGDRIYLYSGGADTVIVEPIVTAAYELYRKLGVPETNLLYKKGGKAGHAIVVEEGGLACGITEEPYLNDCDYDQAGAILAHIYGRLEPPSSQRTGDYLEFDQTPFLGAATRHGMAASGVVYVPRDCRAGGCRIHVAFHGCAQGREFVGDAHIKGAGFERWADTNRLIVLYPQVRSEAYNPQGCWDWWGYTGLDYRSRASVQIRAVRAMIDRLASN